MTRLRIWSLAAVLVVGLVPTALGSSLAPCTIVEGTAIGGVRLGMPVRMALAITGTPLRQRADGSRVLYVPPAPWSEVVAEYDVIDRVSTRSPACATVGGIGPGSKMPAVREAYAGATASLSTTELDGVRLSYPFLGAAFLLRHDRVDSVEIFRPSPITGSRWPAILAPAATSATAPTSAPAPAAASWTIRSSSWRLEDTTFVVTGVAENHGPPVSAFAEVSAFDRTGRLVGSNDGLLDPSPLRAGGVAIFEARLAIDDAVGGYTVIVRPAGSISVALAQQAIEIPNPQAFAPLVLRKLRVTVEFRGTPTRFLVTVANTSSVALTAATIVVDVTGTCFIQMVNLVRSLSYQGSGVVVMSHVRPGGSGQATMAMPPDVPGGCQDLATAIATPRVIGITLSD